MKILSDQRWKLWSKDEHFDWYQAGITPLWLGKADKVEIILSTARKIEGIEEWKKRRRVVKEFY